MQRHKSRAKRQSVQRGNRRQDNTQTQRLLTVKNFINKMSKFIWSNFSFRRCELCDKPKRCLFQAMCVLSLSPPPPLSFHFGPFFFILPSIWLHSQFYIWNLFDLDLGCCQLPMFSFDFNCVCVVSCEHIAHTLVHIACFRIRSHFDCATQVHRVSITAQQATPFILHFISFFSDFCLQLVPFLICVK